MDLQQTEQAILATLLVDRGAASIVKPELTADKFSYGPATTGGFSKAHSLIYSAMICTEGRIDTVSIMNQLGEDIGRVGGEAYIVYLANSCLPQLGIRSTESLPSWVQTVDTGGRLRQVSELFEVYSPMFQDFVGLLDKVEDVDTFIADIQEKLNRIILGSGAVGYKHISTATSEYRRILEDEAAGYALTYYPVGWPSFEKFALPPQSALMVLSGLSSVGKSQLMLQLALGAAIQIKAAGVPGCVAINSYEMTGWRCSRRMAACLAGVDYQSAAVRDESSAEYKSLMNSLSFIETLPIFYDDTDMTSAQMALQTTRVIAQNGPIVFMGVDYAEEVPDPDVGSEELRISNIFRSGKRLAMSTGMCCCILSQVSDIAQFPNGIVPYNRLRYSRAATNAADVICYVYNPPQMRQIKLSFTFAEELGSDAFAYVLVQKNRDGKVGAFPMEWTPNITRFEDRALVGFGHSELYRNLESLGFIKGWYKGEEDF